MPVPKYLGDRPTITGDRQVAAQPGSKAAQPPIQKGRYCRNGRHPDANFMNALGAAGNAAMVFRTKEFFSMGTILGQSSGLPVSSFGAGSRARWRFGFRTSTYSNALLCRAVMYPQTSGYTYDSYAKLTIFSDIAEATAVATVEFHYGPNPLQSNTVSGWQYLKITDKWGGGLTPDTEYYARVDDVDYGLIQSLCVAEMQSATQVNGGYLPTNFTGHTPIFDEYRANIVETLKPLWTTAGSKVLNWSVDDQTSPASNSISTPTNLIDQSSTTYGSSVPGFTLNMTGKARLSQSSGVPCVMKIHARNNGVSAKGRFYLKDSTGTTIASITDGWSIGTTSWRSMSFNLPATSAKYYLMFDNNGAGALQIYAVSAYEYG